MNLGDRIPSFKAYDQDWNEFNSEELRNVPVVIFFYPKDNTPGCIKEACTFRDHIEDFNDIGAKVIGISADKPETHKQFADRFQLPYTLLYDRGDLKDMFSVKDSFFGFLPSRETFVFDANGILIHHFTSQMRPDKHTEEALSAIKELVGA